MERKEKQFLEIKMDAPGLAEGEFEAWVATYNGNPTGKPDSYGDFIATSAFDLDLRTRGSRRPLLWMHQPETPIGYIDLTSVPNYGLKGRGKFLLDVEKGREAHILTKAGLVKFSFGFEDEQSSVQRDGTRLLKQIKIFEASAVSFPANEAATLIDVKARGSDDLGASIKRLSADIETASVSLQLSDMRRYLNDCILRLRTR